MNIRQYTAYLLHFPGPLHIGDVRDDYGVSLKTISSDTMYAAITATLAKIGETIPEDGNLGCTISSLFPYYQPTKDATPILFYPRPMHLNLICKDSTNIKKLKKVAWIDQSYLEKFINQVPADSDTIVKHIHDNYLTAEQYEPFIKSQVKARVTVSRIGEDAKPFYMDDIYFIGNSGLFFLIEGDTSCIDKVLPLLSQEGLGTDRNVGHGYFEYTKHGITIQVPTSANASMILSAYIPESQDALQQAISEPFAAYEFSRRGGWITTSPYNRLRKNAIYAFTAGSVLNDVVSGAGKIVDLAPKGLINHPIWRCGKTIVLPIKL